MALYSEFDYTTVTKNGNGADGSITFLNYSGGSGQYEFAIGFPFGENFGSGWQESPVFTGLTAGGYANLVIRDKNNPSDIYTVHNEFVLKRSPEIYIWNRYYNNPTYFDLDDVKDVTAIREWNLVYLFKKNDNTIWFYLRINEELHQFIHPTIGSDFFDYVFYDSMLYNWRTKDWYLFSPQYIDNVYYLNLLYVMNRDYMTMKSFCAGSGYMAYITNDNEVIFTHNGVNTVLNQSNLNDGFENSWSFISVNGNASFYTPTYPRGFYLIRESTSKIHAANNQVINGQNTWVLSNAMNWTQNSDVKSVLTNFGAGSITHFLKNDGTLWNSESKRIGGSETYDSLIINGYSELLLKKGSDYYVLEDYNPYTPNTPYRVNGNFDKVMLGFEFIGFGSFIRSAYNLSATTSYTNANLTWTISLENLSGVTEQKIELFSGGTWIIIDTLDKEIEEYTVTGLTPNTTYAFRIITYDIYDSYLYSESYSFTTLDPSPYNLQAIDVDYFSAEIQWELPDPYGDEIQVQIREIGTFGSWTTVDTLSNTATGYTITNLNDNTIYDCRVVLIGSEYPSNTIQFTTLEIVYPKSFCEGINYIVSGATCGNSTGTIFISNIDYLILYDFKLEDIDGNSYELSDNAFKGLTSNYYFLSATPKPAYWSTYGKTPCTFEWIKIESTDTTLSLTQVSVQHAICQGFGRSRGRIGYVFADSYTGFTSTPDYNLKIYNTSKELVYDETLTGLTSPFIFNAIPACYNAVLTNGNDCTYFIENVCVQGLNAMTVEGIDELYLTKYNSDIIVNYWGLEDENYYIGGYDSNFYTSTKIKEILNYDIWYQIPLDSADASYSQQLIRGSNGITYEESIDIVVHHKDVQKWLDMIALLRDRYVIVFRDNNENWWTFGYQSGTEIRQYRLEENAYKFTFFQPAVTKLLTAISEDYVNTYIK